MYTLTLFKFAALSKDQAGFPNETFFQRLFVHGKLCWSSFSSYYKNQFLFINFLFLFICFAYLVKFISLIHSRTEQCFYYKNYTSLVKKAFDRQIFITNSFKNLKTKKQSYSTSDNGVTLLQNFQVAFVIKLLQKITILSVVIAVTVV